MRDGLVRSRVASRWMERAHSLAEIAAFTGSIHFGMARQDLFDQRRARTRHTDDEDWQARRIAIAFLVAHQVGGEDLSRAFDPPENSCLLIGHCLALKRVACQIMTERAFIFADISERIGEGEMEIALV